MRDKLKELIKNAYAPYSNYHVAAIVLMKDGSEFKGVNVENASYGGTICAERNAINAAITAGYKKNDFDKIYLMTLGRTLALPCLICRQTMVEFFNMESKLIVMNEKEEREYLISDIIVNPFTEEDLV